MQTRIAIRLETHDRAQARDLFQALSLVGGREAATAKGAYRPFALIESNDFTLDDVDAAVGVIRRLRTDIYSRHESNPDTVFVAGVHGNADHAVNLAEKFMHDVRADFRAATA